MDLTKYELPEDVKAQIMAQYNTETEGLRTSKEAILAEKKTLQLSSVEQLQQLEESRLANNKLAEQKLIDEGKYTEALALRETEFSELSAKEKLATKTAQDALQSRDYGTSESKLLSMFHNDHKEVGEALLSKGLKIGYNDQGQPITTFEYGGKVVATGIDEIKGWAGESTIFKQYLNGVDSSGANTTQSRGSASTTNKPYSEMSLKEQVAHNRNVNPVRN